MNVRRGAGRILLIVLTALPLVFAQGCLDVPWIAGTGTPAATTAAATEAPTATAARTASPSAARTTAARTPGRLDPAALAKLDNETLSWWFIANDAHEPTSIDPGVKAIADAHGGVWIGDPDSMKVYLTFDEGYENGYTASILDTLKANGVRAIFFITKPYLDANPDLVRRMVEEGHQVGNHSVSHLSFPSLDDATLEAELQGVDDAFYALYHKHMAYFRPPMGEYSVRTLEAARQLGYETVFWSYAYKDWDTADQKGPDHAFDAVMANHHPGAVFLLHAVSSDNAGALDRIIKGLKAAGYSLAPFDL